MKPIHDFGQPHKCRHLSIDPGSNSDALGSALQMPESVMWMSPKHRYYGALCSAKRYVLVCKVCYVRRWSSGHGLPVTRYTKSYKFKLHTPRSQTSRWGYHIMKSLKHTNYPTSLRELAIVQCPYREWLLSEHRKALVLVESHGKEQCQVDTTNVCRLRLLTDLCCSCWSKY